jgi:prefoldin subunit 5
LVEISDWLIDFWRENIMGFSHGVAFVFGVGLGVYASENYDLRKALSFLHKSVKQKPEFNETLEEVKKLEKQFRKPEK